MQILPVKTTIENKNKSWQFMLFLNFSYLLVHGFPLKIEVICVLFSTVF